MKKYMVVFIDRSKKRRRRTVSASSMEVAWVSALRNLQPLEIITVTEKEEL